MTLSPSTKKCTTKNGPSNKTRIASIGAGATGRRERRIPTFGVYVATSCASVFVIVFLYAVLCWILNENSENATYHSRINVPGFSFSNHGWEMATFMQMSTWASFSKWNYNRTQLYARSYLWGLAVYKNSECICLQKKCMGYVLH